MNKTFTLYGPSKNRAIRVLLAGVGGSGSRMAVRLSELHKGLVALGRPGLELVACDPKRVTQASLVRQAFYPFEVGRFKAEALISRINAALGVHWQGLPARVQDVGPQNFDLVVSCLDSAPARIALRDALKPPRYGQQKYQLDLGNGKNFGQWILGGGGLPSPYVTLPALLEETEEDRDTPSCSALESLLRQDLYINETVSLFAAQLLWTLFTGGEVSSTGGFINLENGSLALKGPPQLEQATPA